jgi:uncharacterized protein YciI
MMKRFVFCYTMTDAVHRIRDTVPAHVAYWERASLEHYRGGPFADRSGGLITFGAADLAAASAIVERDPFVLQGLVRDQWVKEWLA